jgi:MFS family permease
MALGSMVGSVALAPFSNIGRWKCVVISDIAVIAGSLMTFSTNLYILYVGRFLYGMSSGAFGVFCSKYITEVSPIEIRGSTGVLM